MNKKIEIVRGKSGFEFVVLSTSINEAQKPRLERVRTRVLPNGKTRTVTENIGSDGKALKK